jgi:adhesin/invasin
LWATGGVTTSNVLTVNVIAGPPDTATVAVSPDTLPADGISTYTIALTNIIDAFGNTISDGTPITIAVQSVPPVIKTGTTMDGTMVEILQSSTNAGTHPIVVTGLGGSLTLNGDTAITFTPGSPARAYISASPKVLPADGTSTANLAITIQDKYSNLVADNTPITVTTSAGSLTGSSTTANGQISRILRSAILLNTAHFTVESSTGPLVVLGDVVTFAPGSPAQALVTAVPAKVLADGVSTSQVTVTIKDGYGFTVPGNKPAVLSAIRGSLIPTYTVASTGSLTTTFRAGTSLGLAGLSIAYDGILLPTIGDALELIPGPPVSATISANPISLAVGSKQQSLLTISLFDKWGHPVPVGTAVTVTTSLGSILSDNTPTHGGIVTRAMTSGLTIGTAMFTVTTGAGTISPVGSRVTLTSGNLDHIDLLPAGGVQVVAGNRITFTAVGYDAFGNEAGTSNFTWRMWPNNGYGNLSSSGVFTGTIAGEVGVQASQGTIYSQIKDVTVLPSSPVTALVSASPITIPVGGANSILTITARDTFGNLVANSTVLTVTTNLGTIGGSSTTKNGLVTRTLISGNYYGTATLVVNDFEAGGDRVSFVPQSRLTANPGSLYADGRSQTIVTIEVFDTSGLPVVDGIKPHITTSLGVLQDCGNGTIAGKLTCVLQSSLTPGVAQIYLDNILVEGSIPFVIGPASVARIRANPPWLMPDGVSQAALTIGVEDAFGHVITDAGLLTVTTNLGIMSGLAPTVNGMTTRALMASTQSGVAAISVAGLNTVGDSKIHFVGTSLQDSSFESGGLNNWSVGRVVTPTGATPAYSATILSSDQIGGIIIIPPSGSEMVRLGATTTDKTDHQLSEAWLSQPVYVSSGGLAQVTFLYRILSYDVAVGSSNNGYKEWDPFEVYLNGREVLQDGFRWSQEWDNWYQSSPTSPKDMGWKQGVLDLTPYVDQVVTLEFRLPNRQAPRDNTWVYLDGFNLKFMKTKSYQVSLPLLLR